MSKSSTKRTLCSVNSETNSEGDPLISDAEKQSIRRLVCRGRAEYLVEGERYCILHAPTDEKEYSLFECTVLEKMESGEPDFRGAWFPNNFDISQRTFDTLVDFSYAHFQGHCFFNIVTFKETVFFLNAKFLGNTAFQHCNFHSTAYFNHASFGSYITFRFAEFMDGCLFWESQFCHVADFQKTNFHQVVDFSGTRFTNPVDFTQASFGDALYLGPMNFENNAQMIIK